MAEQNSNIIIDSLKQLVQESRQSGQMIIPIQALEGFLNESWLNHEAARHKYMHEMEVWKIEAPLKVQHDLEMLKGTLETGQTAIKSLTLINGAASLAMLTFIGSLATKEVTTETIQITALFPTLMIFAGGVGCAGITSAARYFSQDWYIKNETVGDVFKWIGIFFGIASLILYFVGCWHAGQALLYPPSLS